MVAPEFNEELRKARMAMTTMRAQEGQDQNDNNVSANRIAKVIMEVSV